MKKKFNNKKNISMLLAGLAAISIASVGFSAWIISGSTPVTTSVSVEVGDVIDRRITLAIATGDTYEDLNIKFECDGAENNPIQSSGDARQDMQFTIVFTMYANDSSAFSTAGGWSGVTLTFATKNLYALTNGNVVVAPFTVAQDGSSTVKLLSSIESSGSSGKETFVSVSGTGTSTDPYKCTVQFNFTWGTAVKGKNPTQITSTEIDTGVYTAMGLLDTAHTTPPEIGITVSI